MHIFCSLLIMSLFAGVVCGVASKDRLRRFRPRLDIFKRKSLTRTTYFMFIVDGHKYDHVLSVLNKNIR